jgi:hypothetical protein
MIYYYIYRNGGYGSWIVQSETQYSNQNYYSYRPSHKFLNFNTKQFQKDTQGDIHTSYRNAIRVFRSILPNEVLNKISG